MLSKTGCILLILTPVIKYLAPSTFRTGCISDAKFFIKPILIFFSGSVLSHTNTTTTTTTTTNNNNNNNNNNINKRKSK
jgi:hypothetical protein